MDLAAIQAFVSVVETRSFTGAATRLRRSKSSVSKQVAALEDQLGARLLNRTTRRIDLTDVGATFFERCRHILEQLDEAQRVVGQLQATPRGTLRVRAATTFGRVHLVPCLKPFLATYPELDVDLVLTDHTTHGVDQRYDVSVRIAHLPDSDLIARKIAPLQRVICASPAYLATHAAPTTPQDLTQHACALYRYLGAGADTWSLVGPTGQVDLEVSGPFHTDDAGALLEAALNGIGPARLPMFLAADALRSGRLVRLLEDWREPEPTPAIYAVYPHTRHLSAKVRVFVDHLVACFGQDAPWGRNGSQPTTTV